MVHPEKRKICGSQLIVLLLLAIALRVLLGLLAGESMWGWIAAYWAVLTAKNIADYCGGRKNERADERGTNNGSQDED